MNKHIALMAGAAVFLASPAFAQEAAKPQTMQQRFDAASHAAVTGHCDKAVSLFSEIENSPAVMHNATAKATISLRKGLCLVNLSHYDQGRDLIEAGLPALAGNPEFRLDLADAYLALGKVGYYNYDFDAARRALREAREVQGVKPTLDTMIWSARATMFEPGDDAIAYAQRALDMARANPEMTEEMLAGVQTLHARALLNQGRVKDGYDELKDALHAQGGLSCAYRSPTW